MSKTLNKGELVRRWGFPSCCCRLFDLDPDLLPLFRYNCKQFASPQECLSTPEFLDHIRKVREGLWHGQSAAPPPPQWRWKPLGGNGLGLWGA